jgi:hypothetical protein
MDILVMKFSCQLQVMAMSTGSSQSPGKACPVPVTCLDLEMQADNSYGACFFSPQGTTFATIVIFYDARYICGENGQVQMLLHFQFMQCPSLFCFAPQGAQVMEPELNLHCFRWLELSSDVKGCVDVFYGPISFIDITLSSDFLWTMLRCSLVKC